MSEKNINKDENQFSGDEKNEEFLGVPQNYFESFSSRLFKKIEAEDELKDYPLLSSIGKNNPFTIPQNYFDLREELLQYPSLVELRTLNFTVPANYFNEVTFKILNRIEVIEEMKVYETLSSIDKRNSFGFPENYFEVSANKIINAVEVAEETKIYEILSSIDKQNVFGIPEKYFEQLNIPFESETKEAKVISLFAQVKTTYKVAMAAAVALIVSLSILFYNQNNEVQSNNECHTMACLSKKEILNSNYIQSVSEESIIEMIDVKALSDSLSLKKNGKTQKIDADEVSEEMDVNTITDAL